ncbi:MAG: nitroreductase [Clostridiaceae bacterium]|nr:nitroreductase [Clostridiaceae bacterium]
MNIIDILKKRRSYYEIDRNLPVSEEKILQTIDDVVQNVPDAFNLQSQRVVVAMGEYQDKLWDAIYDVFGGKVKREKIDSFKAAYGTVLFYYDEKTIKETQANFPRYAENFPVWANQSNGMLQHSIWLALRELDIGANLQHYNPVIDAAVRELFDIPEDWVLLAQMPFGNILEEPEPKDKLDIRERVKVFK